MGSGPEGVDATRARGRHLVRACNSESNPAKAEEVATAAHGALMALLGRLRLVAPLGLVGLVVSLQLMLLSHPSAVGGLPAPLSLHTFGERVRLICRVWLPWGGGGMLVALPFAGPQDVHYLPDTPTGVPEDDVV